MGEFDWPKVGEFEVAIGASLEPWECGDHLADVLRARIEALRAQVEALTKPQEPVAYWIPKAEQFCIAAPGGRPFAKAWEPLYSTPSPLTRPAVPDLYQIMAAAKAIHATTPGADEWDALHQCEVDALRARAEAILLAATPHP